MFIKEHWFWRGAQSAAFYYISCAPCTKVAYRRKRRKESQRAKEEKERAMAEAGPSNPYPEHPLPSSTNPYWREEMTLGPGPPPRRRRKDDEGRLIEMQPSSSGIVSSNGSKGTSSDTMDGGNIVLEPPQESRESDEGWNRRRYQREDEVLWGLDESVSHSTGMSTLSHSNSRGQYYYARNPAVNDLHPPVVSTAPSSRAEIRWMLQPPPKAKIMEGKEKANRSRSGSGGSNGSRGSSFRKAHTEQGLGRLLSERLVESKLKNGELEPYTPTDMSRSRGSSRQSHKSGATSAQGQGHDRDQEDDLVNGAENLSLEPSNVSRALDTASNIPLPPPVARPPLSSIPSTSLIQKTERAATFLVASTNQKASDSVKSTPNGPSLAVLQDLDPNPRSRYSNLKKDPLAEGEQAVRPSMVKHLSTPGGGRDNEDDDDDDPRFNFLPAASSRLPKRKGWDLSSSKGLSDHKGDDMLDINKESLTRQISDTRPGLDLKADENGLPEERYAGIGHRHRWSMYI